MTQIRNITLGTAGHIDHGKTALVRALTGVDCDRLPEEQARGVTIDLGFAHFEARGVQIGIVDVPGHERFIRNMLAGATGIDMALLVVAADDGVMPQTREHLDILDLLGVSGGVVAITKCDIAKPDRLDALERELRDFTAHSCLAQAPIVRTSAQSGMGVETLRDTIIAQASTLGCRRSGALPFRLPIDRVFTVQGYGVVVTGTVASGSVRVGDALALSPSGAALRVRGVQTHGESTEVASAGQRTAINVKGADISAIARGDVLSAPGAMVSTQRIAVGLRMLGRSDITLKHDARVRFHIGTSETIATVSLLESKTLDPGQSGLALLRLQRPVACVGAERFILRSESPVTTFAGGEILLPLAPALRRTDAQALSHLSTLYGSSGMARAASAIYFLSATLWTLDDLVQLTGEPAEALAPCVQALLDEQTVEALDNGLRMHAQQLDRLVGVVRAHLQSLHTQSPHDAFVPVDRVRHRLPYLEASVVEALLKHMVEMGSIKTTGAGVALASHTPPREDKLSRLRSRIVDTLRSAPFSPPTLDALCAACNASEKEVRTALTAVESSGEIIHIGGVMWIEAQAETSLREKIETMLDGSAGLTLGEIKTALGTSRKYAVPLCEYLDRIGVTKRVGDKRVLGRHAKVVRVERSP